MAIFAPTSSSYSDPYKALTLKALETRQQDFQRQMAEAQTPKAETPMAVAGVGLGAVGDALKSYNMNQAANAKRDQLSALVAGIDPVKGPTPQQQAAIMGLDRELAGTYMKNQYDSAREERKYGFEGGQKDLDRKAAAEQAAALDRRQREMQAELLKAQAEQGDLTRRHAFDMADKNSQLRLKEAEAARAFEAAQAELTRAEQTGQIQLKDRLQAKRDEAQRAHELAKQAVQNAFEASQPKSKEGMQGADIKAGHTTTEAVEAANLNPKKIEARTESENSYRMALSHIQGIDKAIKILTDNPEGEAIHHGMMQQGGPAMSNVPILNNFVDKAKAARTAEFNSVVGGDAIKEMSKTLTGSTTNFELNKFEQMRNNPAFTDKQRAEQLARVREAAVADAETLRIASQSLKGDPSRVEKAMTPGPTPVPGSNAPGAPVYQAKDEADALAQPLGTKFKLPDGRTGTVR